MSKYRILSLDGGGIRGLITAVLLDRLREAVPGWMDKIDLVAGTSTGGIIAMGLAKGATPNDVRDLYYKNGHQIFDKSWLNNLKDIGGLAGAEYDNVHLRQELIAFFGTTKLKELHRKVLVASFDLDNQDPDPTKRSWKPKFFHNFEGEGSDGDCQVVDVALYTSAAPTYFPSVDTYIDGGVAANNPSLAALTQTQDSRIILNPRPKLEEVVLLSLGTGRSLARIEGKNLDWGLGQWARPIINILMDSVVGVADYQCRQLMGDCYARLNPTFPPEVHFGLDDVAHMDAMLKFAAAVNIDDTVSWLKQTWQ
ncbi:MAG: patatin-like phospholipase family protein [Chloroflexi bacterium]|uniref:Patatin-like phospholipase family protein n=1 Tax=Candidatus Chlorohelix allophototropha TaxID=3003348 RepID=A0A8T7MAB3_9CHLR|nr:patatin-like phospholipase family protein [Chloroflexota bacterium]WJW69018.1 patatin-like phospholipase family protein [Chloroflexota bacterium L227-S17]